MDELRAKLEIAFDEQDYGSFQALSDELFLLIKERKVKPITEDNDGIKVQATSHANSGLQLNGRTSPEKVATGA